MTSQYDDRLIIGKTMTGSQP